MVTVAVRGGFASPENSQAPLILLIFAYGFQGQLDGDQLQELLQVLLPI